MPTKLSNLIRIGAQHHPQCTDNFCEVDDNGQIMATCALGAAIVAAGQEQVIIDYNPQDINVITALEEATDTNLAERVGSSSIWYQIVIRNDSGETREEIAAWLEGLGL